MLTQRLLNGGQFGFHLDDEEQRLAASAGKDVDRSMLAIHRVTDLGRRLPPERHQAPERIADECRMSFVEEPIDQSTTPANVELGRRVERAEDQPDDPQRRSVEVSALQQRDLLLADAGPHREVDLAPSEAQSKRADEPAHTHVVHGRKRGRPASPEAYRRVASAGGHDRGPELDRQGPVEERSHSLDLGPRLLADPPRHRPHAVTSTTAFFPPPISHVPPTRPSTSTSGVTQPAVR